MYEKQCNIVVSYAGEKLLPSEKYKMSEYALNDYSWQMNLTVNFLEKRDFGEYVCSSVNALGKADGIVHLQGKFSHNMTYINIAKQVKS